MTGLQNDDSTHHSISSVFRNTSFNTRYWILHVTIALCLMFTACFHGDVQLVNDNNVNNIVEFCYKGEWRRICVSDKWDMVEANIVCSGYSNQSNVLDLKQS